MYGTNRKIKRNPVVKKIVNGVAPIVTNTHPKLKSNGLGKYRFPIYDEIPMGDYYSKIKNAKFTTTKSGKEAVEVFYEIKDGPTCYKIANGILPEDTVNPPYYVKQIYPEGTIYYDKFVDSMAEALGIDDFDCSDVIDVTEYVTLSYDKGDIGGFSNRYPLEWDDFVQANQSDDDDDYLYADEDEEDIN